MNEHEENEVTTTKKTDIFKIIKSFIIKNKKLVFIVAAAVAILAIALGVSLGVLLPNKDDGAEGNQTYNEGTGETKTYKVEVALQDGVTGEAPTFAAAEVGETIIFPDGGTLSKEGYFFAGWSDGVTVYSAGESYTMPSNGVTFTPTWTEATYTVTFYDGETVLKAETVEANPQPPRIPIKRAIRLYRGIKDLLT